MPPDVLKLGYLISAILFIYGLKGLTSPRTAVRGNVLGALGMLLAVVITLWTRRFSATAGSPPAWWSARSPESSWRCASR